MEVYIVYETNMLLTERDERYEEVREHENTDLEGDVFETLEDAEAFFNEVVESWDTPYEIIHTKRGLDTVKFKAAWIDMEEIGEDGFLYDDPVNEVMYVDSLPDEVRMAAAKHQSEYWDFLDYKRNNYSPLEA